MLEWTSPIESRSCWTSRSDLPFHLQLRNLTVQHAGLRNSCSNLGRVRLHLRLKIHFLLSGIRHFVNAIRLVAACGWPLTWLVLWSRQIRHKRQHLETVSLTGREPKPTVVVATGAAQASTSGDGELNRERTEANCCGRDRCSTSVNIWRR